VRYFYKKPGDWVWRTHETSSLAADAAKGLLRSDWRYHCEGEAQEASLSDLIRREQAIKQSPRSAAELELLAPDGTLGVITVVLYSIPLALALFLSFWPGFSLGGRLGLLGAAVVGIGHGLRRIQTSRRWRRRHRSDLTRR
jgi:hypothetical protein